MKIAVVGTGYVGLVTGTCLAEVGNNVTCVDIDEVKISKLVSGELTIYEPELDNLFLRNVKEGRLNFTTNLQEGVQEAEVIFLALPTPPGEDGSVDLSYILRVANELGPILSRYCVIVDKSTVPVGTAEKVRATIAQKAKTDFDVVSNPEFLREGFAVSDFMKPDRIVIGTSSLRARHIMERLYKPFIDNDSPIYVMDERSAEMTKYAANSFLALKISFMNEIANLSELAGTDVDAIRLGIGSDERIGHRFLFAGIGYGGSCFPKDVQGLYKTAQEFDYDFKILKSVMAVNKLQKKILVSKVKKFYGSKLSGKTFALWGLAFKPDTDDIREAPAIDIIKDLTAAGANIRAFDPEAEQNMQKLFVDNKRVVFCDHQAEALEDADALLIVTEWPVFRTPDFEKLKTLKDKAIFDGRNIYDPKELAKHGLYYESIGREVIDG